MLEWCMAYPWMTLTIAILALIVLDNIVANIGNAIAVRAKYKAQNMAADRACDPLGEAEAEDEAEYDICNRIR